MAVKRNAWYRSRGYPDDWEERAAYVRDKRAGGRCECNGECGHYHGSKPGSRRACGAKHGSAHPVTGSRVILQVAHVDHDSSNCVWSNLRAMCQRCHLGHDRRDNDRRKRLRAHEALEAAGQMRLKL